MLELSFLKYLCILFIETTSHEKFWLANMHAFDFFGGYIRIIG